MGCQESQKNDNECQMERDKECQQKKTGLLDGSFAATKSANEAVKRRRNEASLASPLN